jgi:hypothetical protein
MPTTDSDPKWKRFERLVAGLHHALSPAGAVVTWDDKIAGRQFDITIRFSQVAYEFLTIIECKDYLVPVGDVDAFVTKARSAQANKAVIVSSVGFQSGALKVASDHGVDLYVLDESDQWPPGVRVVAEEPALSIVNVEILNDEQALHRFSDSPSALTYFMNHVAVWAPTAARTLDDIIMSARDVWEVGTNDTPQSRTISLPAGAIVNVPFVDPMYASAVRFETALVSAKTLDTGGMDISLLPQLFRFKNAITGEERTIDAAELWIGFDTQVQKDRFYYNPFLSIVYFCEDVKEGIAHYTLLESYQHGQLFQARFTQKVLYGRHLLEVTEAKELLRLQRMLQHFRNDAGIDVPIARVGPNDTCPCGSGAKYKKCHGK